MSTTAAPVIDTTLCSGCGRCVSACPLHLISLEVSGFRKTAVLSNAELCTGCRECVKSCLLKALIESAEGHESPYPPETGTEGNQTIS